MTQRLPPVTMVETDDRLKRAVDVMASEAMLAVDTESNSLYAYRERVCLIQISTRQQDFIIDPLAVHDMSPLAPLFASETIEKVFHAATYDVMTMKRDFGFTFRNLFDTMIAARICGFRAIGLNNLVSEIIGLQLDKSHQRDDWGVRPLSRESLLYAQTDTHYLPAIRDHFDQLFTERGLWREVRETFGELNRLPAANHVFDPEGYWRLGKPSQLRARPMAILRELYLWRENTARRIDLPPFKILQDKVLVAVAQTAPSTPEQLSHVDGMTPGLQRRFGAEVLKTVERGRHAALPTPPPTEPPADPFVVEVYTALREWRKHRAESRGVEADVILAREALWALAEHLPTTLDELRAIPSLGEWRKQTYGEELLGVLARFKKPES